jgi:hypothetical protein
MMNNSGTPGCILSTQKKMILVEVNKPFDDRNDKLDEIQHAGIK